MQRKLPLCALVLALAGFAAVGAEATEICPRKFPILTTEPPGHVPFCSSRPIHVDDATVERILLALHSSNFDAPMAYESALAATAQAPGEARRTLVVAPQFLARGSFKDSAADPRLVFWDVRPFWGSSRALTDLGRRELRLSAYAVLETLVGYLTRPRRFPNLETVVVLGHSAGGQMVNRLAASSRFEPAARKIEVRFVVMNPSSYVYFDNKRGDPPGEGSFSPPSPEAVAACPGYDRYGYGLDRLYAFHRQAGLSAKSMREIYRKRHVVYLVGSEDRGRKGSLSTHCAAELQGRHRLERATTYFRHLIDHFGPSIQERQTLEIVPGVGHSGRDMMTSSAGLRHLFGDG